MDRSSFRILYVSNVDLYKHQWHVVEAVKLIRDKGFDCTLRLLGGGSGLPLKKLNEKVAKCDPDGVFVELLPFVSHEHVVGHLREADVFVFASSCENMPNTLVEAMAAGLPIASSNRGPMPEVLEDAGLYFDPEDSASISACLETLLSDRDLRNRLAHDAENLAKRYSWTVCAQKTHEYLSEILSVARPR